MRTRSGVLLEYNANADLSLVSPYIAVRFDGSKTVDKVYLAHGSTINAKVFYCETLPYSPNTGVCPKLPDAIVPPLRVTLLTWTGPTSLFKKLVLATDTILTVCSGERLSGQSMI